MSGILAELQRRRVFRVAGLYAVTSWVLLQVADVLTGLLGLPDWTLRFVLLLLLLGFPIALLLSWAYDLTPEGLRRTSRDDPDPAATRHALHHLEIVVAAALVLVVGYLFWSTDIGDETQTIKEGLTPSSALEEHVAEAPPTAPEPDAAAPLTAIAVLPFVSMSADEDDQYFADGLSDTLLHRLARFGELQVIARTSSFAFKGRNEDVREIGRILSVGSLLEGSVQRAGERLRVIAQLVETEGGTHLWSETFDRDAADVFAIQDEIAEAVAAALQVEVLAGGEQRAVDPEAYDYYLRGLELSQLETTSANRAAADFFRRSIETDADFAQAHASLALVSFQMIFQGGVSMEEAFAKIETHTTRALEIDPQLAAALRLRGLMDFRVRGDMESAERNLRAAVVADPNDASSRVYLGYLLYNLQRYEEAWAEVQLGYKLNPLDRMTASQYAGVLAARGEPEKGIELLERRVAFDEGDVGCMSCLAQRYFSFGRVDLGIYWRHRVLLKDPENAAETQEMALYMHALGDRERANAWADKAIALSSENPAARYGRFHLNLEFDHLGEVEATLDQLMSSGELQSGAPQIWNALAGTAMIYLDRPGEAIELLETALAAPGWAGGLVLDLHLYGNLAQAHLAMGDTPGARRVAADGLAVVARAARQGLRSTDLTYAAARLNAYHGNIEEAIAGVVSAVDRGFVANSRPPGWKWMPSEIEDDPRYRAAMARVDAELARQRDRVAAADESGDWDLLRGAVREFD